MNIQPPNDKILIELVKEEVKTASGIILAAKGIEKNSDDYHPHSIHMAIVKHVGRECKFLKVGDKILIEYCFTRPFAFRDMEYKITQENQIVGVVQGNLTISDSFNNIRFIMEERALDNIDDEEALDNIHNEIKSYYDNKEKK